MIGRTLLNLVTIGSRIIWLAAIAPRWRGLTLLGLVIAGISMWLVS